MISFINKTCEKVKLDNKKGIVRKYIFVLNVFITKSAKN
tara:strand:+ start:365 stop:481 length:117 start_codon:yes stop_codon:yes gene_type:complete